MSVAARGEVGEGEGERVRRWERRVVWAVREVSMTCDVGVVSARVFVKKSEKKFG